jgi:molecular chaperone DnaJ
MSADHYEILGVERDAEPERIRQAYRAAVKESHPDTSATGGGSDRFRAVEEAYETLRDPGRRAAYDRTLTQPRSGPRPLPWTDPFEHAWPGAGGLRRAHQPGFAEGPVLDVLLSRDEAARGARVPVELPVVTPCPVCGGLGAWVRPFCGACGGTGRFRSTCRLDLEIPAGIRDDTDFSCEVDGPGELRSGLLRFVVHVAVEQA